MLVLRSCVGDVAVAWFKVDDNLAFHHKVIAAGNAAIGLWARAGSFSMQQLTDGFIPDHVIPSLGKKAEATRLVQVGLWERVDGGYRFHQWSERQPSKQQVEAERLAARERQQRAREAAAARRNGSSHAVTSGEVTAKFTRESRAPRPDPTINPPTPLPDEPSPPGNERSSADADSDFETFWELYPRPEKRPRTLAAWRQATREATAEHILGALRRQLPTLEATDNQFRPGSVAWLRDQRWDDAVTDEPDPWAHIPFIGPRLSDLPREVLEQPPTGPQWDTPPSEPPPPTRMPDDVRAAITAARTKPTERIQP